MKAEISGGRVDLVLDLDVCVAVGRRHELVGQELPGLRYLRGVELPADEPLNGEDRILGVGDGLALGDLTHETLALRREANDRGRRPRALPVRDDLRVAALHHRDAAVGRAEIDADRLAHGLQPRR